MRNLNWLTGLVFMSLAALSHAADDPSIGEPLRSQIQTSMQEFITGQSHDGIYPHFDPVTGELRQLRLKKLHSGIVKKGDYFVSCADFTDADGKLVDLDFMVLKRGDRLHTQQAIVHKANGKKRPYHLE